MTLFSLEPIALSVTDATAVVASPALSALPAANQFGLPAEPQFDSSAVSQFDLSEKTLASCLAENEHLAKTLEQALFDVRQLVAASLSAGSASSVGVSLPVDATPSSRQSEAIVPASVDALSSQPAASASPQSSVPVMPSQALVETASAVADALIVTPGLMRGEGVVTVQLKSEVLDGAQVTIAVNGRQMEVAFVSGSDAAAALIERNLPQIQQYLGARIHSFTIGVKLNRTRS